MIKSRLCDLVGIKYPIIQAFDQRPVQQGHAALDL